MSIVTCKACGAAINQSLEVRASRCGRCGTTVAAESSRSAGASLSAGAAESHSWLRGLLVRMYCRALIVLMIYVLSTGPLYWTIYEAFHDGGSVFLAKLYFPIALACQYSDTVCDWFDWYVGLWVY